MMIMYTTLPTSSRGTRFSYTYYYPAPPPDSDPIHLSRSNISQSSVKKYLQDHPIHRSITALDHEAIDILTLEGISDENTANGAAAHAHREFNLYVNRTKNTICGRHPIGVLFGALSVLENEHGTGRATVKWVRYAHSSECETIQDSSVSYASAYILI
jgi:hypothetical protein